MQFVEYATFRSIGDFSAREIGPLAKAVAIGLAKFALVKFPFVCKQLTA
jgi:hypothetical protein